MHSTCAHLSIGIWNFINFIEILCKRFLTKVCFLPYLQFQSLSSWIIAAHPKATQFWKVVGSLCIVSSWEISLMFVKLVSRKQNLIPPWTTGNWFEGRNGVFLAHVCVILSYWLGNQMQNPITWSRMFHRSRLYNFPCWGYLIRINGNETFSSLIADPVASSWS